MQNERTVTRQMIEIGEIDIENSRHQIVSLIESVKLSPEFVDEADIWLGAIKDGELVGCMALERRGSFVHIQSLSVKKEFRRQGIAKSLVDKGFNDYLKAGDTITALTLFWNIEVYEKMGFRRMNAAEMKKKDDVAGREKHKHCVAMVREKKLF